jgi:hypothetical protein
MDVIDSTYLNRILVLDASLRRAANTDLWCFVGIDGDRLHLCL